MAQITDATYANGVLKLDKSLTFVRFAERDSVPLARVVRSAPQT